MAKKKSRFFKTLAVIVFLLVLAIVLNPSADKHRAVIKKTIAERSAMDKIFAVGHLTAFASTYHSFFIGSYTTVNDEIQSVGMFGLVVVVAR